MAILEKCLEDFLSVAMTDDRRIAFMRQHFSADLAQDTVQDAFRSLGFSGAEALGRWARSIQEVERKLRIGGVHGLRFLALLAKYEPHNWDEVRSVLLGLGPEKIFEARSLLEDITGPGSAETLALWYSRNR